MKVVYHTKYREVYTLDPAAEAGRMESIYNAVHDAFEVVEPTPAAEANIQLVHTQQHIDSIKKLTLYNNALLAVGGAIKAAELAMLEDPSFGLIRPPGHHAGPQSCWGFCFFNNIAISVEKLRRAGIITRALIVDFDLHYGDGTATIFSQIPEVTYYHLPEGHREHQLDQISEYLSQRGNYDVLALSAGFDRHIDDWGQILETEDYKAIGAIAKEAAERDCGGKRYAVLEGGYNHHVLGKSVKAFLDGFKE